MSLNWGAIAVGGIAGIGAAVILAMSAAMSVIVHGQSRDGRIRIADPGHVEGAGLDVEIFQQVVAAVVLAQLADPAVGIVQVAKGDGVGGAGLLAPGFVALGAGVGHEAGILVKVEDANA